MRLGVAVSRGLLLDLLAGAPKAEVDAAHDLFVQLYQDRAEEESREMALDCINPEDLPTPTTYSQVVVATGTRLVFVAGQEPEDEHGNLVGAGNLAVQARQVFGNVGRALAAAGARPEQVTKLTIYVVGFRREHLPVIEEARVALFEGHRPADAMIGVQTLSKPEYLIEVEAVAIADGAGYPDER